VLAMIGSISAPYPGPRPFTDQETAIFRGREEELYDLRDLIMSYQAVVLYSQSGAGKTSLVEAGLKPLLEKKLEILPVARVAAEVPGCDAGHIANIYASNVVFTSVPERAATATSLSDALSPSSPGQGQDSTRMLILDQFEQFFTAFPDRWRERKDFFLQLNETVNADAKLRMLFVIREDYLAELDAYSEFVPFNFRIRYRLERLRRNQALMAVQEPLLKFGFTIEADDAQRLVENLLKIRLSKGSQPEEIEGEFVEPVHLQVICEDLWRKRDETKQILSVPNKLESLDVALSSFYDAAVEYASREGKVKEGTLRQCIAKDFITSGGTRGFVYRGELLKKGIPQGALDALEHRHIIRGEQRAGAQWYELTHDRFIEPIRTSNAKWGNEHGEAYLAVLEARADEWVRSGSGSKGLLNETELKDAKDWVKRSEGFGLGSEAGLRAFVSASELEVRGVKRRRRRRLLFGLAIALALVLLGITFAVVKYREAAAAASFERRVNLALKESEREHARFIAAEQKSAELGKQLGRYQQTTASQMEAAADKVSSQLRDVRALRRRVETEIARATSENEQTRLSEQLKQLESTEKAASQQARVFRLQAEAARQAANGSPERAQDLQQRATVLSLTALPELPGPARPPVAGNTWAQKLTHESESALESDSTLSAWLALYAVHSLEATANPTILPEAERVLREAAWQADAIPRIRVGEVESDAVPVVISPDGRRIAAIEKHGVVKIWDTHDLRQPPRSISEKGHPITAVAFSGDSSLMAVGIAHARIRVLDFATGTTKFEFHDQYDPAILVFSPDGKRLISAGFSSFEASDTPHLARLWDLSATGNDKPEVLGLVMPQESTVVATLGRRNLYAAGTASGEVVLGTVGPNQDARVIAREGRAVVGLGFSADGKKLAALTYSQSLGYSRKEFLFLWKIGSRAQRAISQKLKVNASVFDAEFDSSGALLAVGSWKNGNELGVRDAESGQDMMTLEGHLDRWADGVGLSPACRFLALLDRKGMTLRLVALQPKDLARWAENELPRQLTSQECSKYLQQQSCPPPPYLNVGHSR
jgi:hypothetical protein